MAPRADALLGAPVEWRFPTTVCLLVAAGVTVIVLVALLAGRVAAGTATLSPPFPRINRAWSCWR